MRAAHQRAQPRGQLVQIDRLDHVVVGAEVQAADAIGHCVARGQHQHRQRQPGLAHGGQHVEPVLARQPEVEHRGGVGLGAQLAFGSDAVAHPVDLEAELAQAGAQAVTQQRVVFGQQDAHGGELSNDQSSCP